MRNRAKEIREAILKEIGGTSPFENLTMEEKRRLDESVIHAAEKIG